MNEVKKLLSNRLEELKAQEKSLRKDQLKLQDRATTSAEHLIDVVKLVNQFEEAITRLDS